MRDIPTESIPRLAPAEVKAALSDGAEIAFLDVREHGQYGEGHPFFCVPAPYSVLEARVPALVPRLSTRCVLLDDGDGVAERAAAAMAGLGYTDVSVVEGGAPGWAAAGHTLFKGVNVPSKAFGELVEHELGTVSLSAEELRAMQESGDPLVVLDGRSGPEFTKMSLPGARSCPNAELGYRLGGLVEDGRTPIVVNCAGRTRSIIGAQTLALLGTANPVYALKNGTQGWRLAGFDLDHGRTPEPLPRPDGQTLAGQRGRAADLIARYGLDLVDEVNLAVWRDEAERTTYLFDVRTAEEYDAAHPTGAVSAPGGQLVQATDEKLATRNARIVLTCDTGLRAATTAIWLRGMGHDAYILDTDASEGAASGAPEPAFEAARVDTLTPADLPGRIGEGALLLDVSKGLDYRDAHIDGAAWVTRPRLPFPDPSDAGIVVTGRSAERNALVAGDLRAAGHACVDVVTAGPEEWRAAELTVVTTPDYPDEAACIDHLFFVHDRHDGNLDAARRYLEWELGLLAQLDEQERGALQPLYPRNDGDGIHHAARN